MKIVRCDTEGASEGRALAYCLECLSGFADLFQFELEQHGVKKGRLDTE